MSRNIEFTPGEFFHVYNRGTEKRNIFMQQTDYERFQALLYIANSNLAIRFEDIKRQGSTLLDFYTLERERTFVDIYAYVLMPNHFHILIKQKHQNGISQFMHKLSTAYTMYFNIRNERTGALFQGRYKAKHVDEDRYLKYLISYIHLNPIKLIEPSWKETRIQDKSAAKDYLNTYTYSSYLDFIGQIRPENAILPHEYSPSYFAELRSFEYEVIDWLSYRD
ncbi:hypothetical protein A2389_02380 [Candidatus Adlerbacteria bacterium RIFOXYB1_FULL_48_10]|nr:MAG: hypothetical protein A2389_02380 [Candidatus Adlerbacteria bacterium RIFOXYB1_FULL_48_10]